MILLRLTARNKYRFQQQAMPLETPTDIVANRLKLHVVARNNSRQQIAQPNSGVPAVRTPGLAINGKRKNTVSV